MTIKELAILLAKAPILEAERRAWSEIIPYLPKSDLMKLGEILQKDVDRLEAELSSFKAEYVVIKKTEQLRHAKSQLD